MGFAGKIYTFLGVACLILGWILRSHIISVSVILSFIGVFLILLGLFFREP